MSLPTTKLIDEDELSVSVEVLRAITHPLRMRILEYIDQQGAINVNRIYSALNLEQSITSQHLRILRHAGLVDTERRGKFIHYRISYAKIARAVAAIHKFQHGAEKDRSAA